MSAATTDAATRIEIVRGGEPTAEQLAALTIALTPVEVPDRQRWDVPGWQHAAIHEGVGARPTATCPADLDLL